MVSVSGIPAPRRKGTVTRIPTEVTTRTRPSSDHAWARASSGVGNSTAHLAVRMLRTHRGQPVVTGRCAVLCDDVRQGPDVRPAQELGGPEEGPVALPAASRTMAGLTW